MSDQPDDDRLVVYSDYVCPFCYLGKDSLDKYRQGAHDPPGVEWRPFDLRAGKRRPDGSIDENVDDGKDSAYFEQAKQNVKRLSKEYNVPMTEDLPTHVDSLPAHIAAQHVQENYDSQTFLAFHAAIFDALWRDGQDIGDPDVLAALAEKVGVDPTGLREALDDDEARRSAEARAQASAQAGVTGVPTFVYKRYGVPGAVPPDAIAALVDHGRGKDRKNGDE